MGPDVMFIFFVLLLLLIYIFIFFFWGGGGGGGGGCWGKGGGGGGVGGGGGGVEGQIFILIPKLVVLERIESLGLTYTANGKRQVESFSK